MSISIRNGRVTIKIREKSETFPDTRDAMTRYSPPLQSFSSVPFRNDEVVPLAKALIPRDIQILPRAKTQKPSANIYASDEHMISIFDTMRVFFCHQ